MAVRGKVLIVEDDRAISNFIRRVLEANGYEALMVHTGREANSMISSHCPDLVILDLGLPDMDGMEVLRSLRRWSLMPVVVVSARTDEREKVCALDAGADDYITKPFGVMEMISRVKALLRRSGGAGDGLLTCGSVTLDKEKRMVYVDGEPVELTYKEFELLRLLMKNHGIVISRDVIMERVWDSSFEGESRTIDVHVRTLRQKLGESGALIKTIRNVGYMFDSTAK